MSAPLDPSTRTQLRDSCVSILPQKAGDFFIRTPKGGERQTGLSEPLVQLLERALAVGLFSGVKGKSSFEELSLQMLSKKLDIRQAWIH